MGERVKTPIMKILVEEKVKKEEDPRSGGRSEVRTAW
jgi:hypothetical protein